MSPWSDRHLYGGSKIECLVMGRRCTAGRSRRDRYVDSPGRLLAHEGNELVTGCMPGDGLEGPCDDGDAEMSKEVSDR